MRDAPVATGRMETSHSRPSERALSSEVIARAVKGRLRGVTEEERQAVTLYISSLMKTKHPEGKEASKP